MRVTKYWVVSAERLIELIKKHEISLMSLSYLVIDEISKIQINELRIIKNYAYQDSKGYEPFNLCILN